MKLPPPKSSAPVNIDLGSGINTSLSLKEMRKEKKLGISQLLDQEILPWGFRYMRAMPSLFMAMAGSALLELLTENSTLASYVWFISGVNFTCQLNRAKETQILCKTVFLSLSVRVFLKEINISVQEDPSSLTWIGILQSVEDQREQKGRRRAKLLSHLSWDLHLLPWGMITPLDSSWTYTIVSPGSQAFDFELEPHH